MQGYLAYWDELLRRHPGMLIDSCASGGRRNDLETLRRAVPLLRSDYQGSPETAVGNQGHTYGISSWIPFYGSGANTTDKYTARSHFMPSFCVGVDARGKVNWPAVRRIYDDCRKVAPYMLGDYYPLTPYSLDNSLWIGWQFDCPEKGEGMVQAFRRAAEPVRIDSREAPRLGPRRSLHPDELRRCRHDRNDGPRTPRQGHFHCHDGPAGVNGDRLREEAVVVPYLPHDPLLIATGGLFVIGGFLAWIGY